MKKINEDENGHNIEAEFSWWSPKFSENEIDRVRDTLRAAIEPFLGKENDKEEVVSQFAKSHAFIPSSERYGSSYFQYGFETLCQRYAEKYRKIGEENSIQFKILGTYVYKKEIMHAVLVCSDKDEQFSDFPTSLMMIMMMATTRG